MKTAAAVIILGVLLGALGVMLTGCTVRRPGPVACFGCTINYGSHSEAKPLP